jgi:hypothetical protein
MSGVCAVGLALYGCARSRDEWPSYGGRSFDYWKEKAIHQDPEAVPVMRDALRHKNPQVRLEAATMLGCLGPQAIPAVPDLVQSLKDADADVRATSARALEAIFSQADFGPEAGDAAGALRAALGDESASVREAATSALRVFERRATFSGVICMAASAASSGVSPSPGGLSVLSTLYAWPEALDTTRADGAKHK